MYLLDATIGHGGIFLCCLGLIILFCGYYRYLHPDNHPREYQYIYYNPDGDSSDKLYTMPGPEMMFWGIAFLFTGALIWYKFRKR